MGRTDQTLMEQMKITRQEISQRKKYLEFTTEDIRLLESLKPLILEHVEEITGSFYTPLLGFDEMDRVIGDAETLFRLKNYQRQYILSLFDGQYDEEYVHSRLRIGMVHRRIGLDPKYYISAVHHLTRILRNVIIRSGEKDCKTCQTSLAALDKIMMFDLSLIVDTYIESLLDENRRSREKLSDYARSLEETVARRTRKLKEQARHDGLTGLLNQASFYEELKRELIRSIRLKHPLTLLYFDLDKFKALNDTKGHKAGDDVLVAVAKAVKEVTRQNEITARYGGDEFCIILPESTIEHGKTVSSRLCSAIEHAVAGTDITCSIGIAASTPNLFWDADSLVKLADKAMYEAKKEPGFSVSISETGEPG